MSGTLRATISLDGRLIDSSLPPEHLRAALLTGQVTRLELKILGEIHSSEAPDTLTGSGIDFLPASIQLKLEGCSPEEGAWLAVYTLAPGDPDAFGR